MNFKRISSTLRYLSWADPIYRWKISAGDCPLCGRTRFIALSKNPFLTRCLTCKANVTNLANIVVMKEHLGNKFDNKSGYELSTYGSTFEFVRRHFREFASSEYFHSREPGEMVNGIMNQDVQNLTFKDNSFDVVSSNQVFEHVPDDIKGYVECRRVLKPGGALIFTVPLYDTPATEEKAQLVDGKIVFNGEPEFHDSRLEGANTSPVFHRHSTKDVCDRVKAAGFTSAELKEVMVVPIQVKPQLVIYAKK